MKASGKTVDVAPDSLVEDFGLNAYRAARSASNITESITESCKSVMGNNCQSPASLEEGGPPPCQPVT
jgi:hypothetical protein